MADARERNKEVLKKTSEVNEELSELEEIKKDQADLDQAILNEQEKKKKKSGEATATRLIVDVFKDHHANNAKRAIPIAAFKDLKLSNTTISYTMANLISQEVVIQTNDQRYWFNEEKWNELSKGVLRGYMMIIVVPLVVALICILLISLHNGTFSIFR
ncbi:hypothetical protein [Catenisphaera adipataccumulans]|jgi:hypothetical protein|uniref:Uncharacterized protein n=1 Tax=Catenisphaera adipataccumulans TaxID=700500 RepID=A0A7W8CZX5_9FIRM|nr:hypothetical protein [Catenisphaera adipataccumulans]MBB5183422.1 hypothetical protein [Catenisphaera adipataccumulans]